MVVGYIAAGCIFTVYFEKWTLLDSIYFWVVTFTTVGLGDILQDEKFQLHEYLAPTVVYRTFGLALLAGFIESLYAYIQVWRKEFRARRAFGQAMCCPNCCGGDDEVRSNDASEIRVELTDLFTEDEHCDVRRAVNVSGDERKYATRVALTPVTGTPSSSRKPSHTPSFF